MFRIAIAAFLCVGAGSAAAATINQDTVGCVSRDDLDRSNEFVRQGDREAYVKFLTDKTMSGECALLDSGDEVSLEEASALGGTFCVRPRGETECFYVIREYVDD